MPVSYTHLDVYKRQPRFYEGFADMMREGKLPIFNWIWFGLYRSRCV